MPVLQWRQPKSQIVAMMRVAGAYAGRARFRPRDGRILPEVLARAAGRVVEFGFAGIAGPDSPFAGQAMYLEWRTDATLDGFLIPEQDLEFLSASADPRG
jgi:hypothetical protein